MVFFGTFLLTKKERYSRSEARNLLCLAPAGAKPSLLPRSGVKTSAAALDQINAPCKALLIYTNDNPIIEEVVPDPAPEQPPHYYYHPTTDTKADETKGSPKTFDAGIGIYAVTAVLSATGMAWTAKKRH